VFFKINSPKKHILDIIVYMVTKRRKKTPVRKPISKRKVTCTGKKAPTFYHEKQGHCVNRGCMTADGKRRLKSAENQFNDKVFWFDGCCYKYHARLTGRKTSSSGAFWRYTFNKQIAIVNNDPNKLLRLICHSLSKLRQNIVNGTVMKKDGITKKRFPLSHPVHKKLDDLDRRKDIFLDKLVSNQFRSKVDAKSKLIALFQSIYVEQMWILKNVLELPEPRIYPSRTGIPLPVFPDGKVVQGYPMACTMKNNSDSEQLSCFNQQIKSMFTGVFGDPAKAEIDLTKGFCDWSCSMVEKCGTCKGKCGTPPKSAQEIAESKKQVAHACLQRSSDAWKQWDKKLFPSQNFVRFMVHPDSPYKGVLAWHSVGTGKTFSALKAMEQFIFDASGYRLVWVTRKSLVGDLAKDTGKLSCALADRLIPTQMSYRAFSGALSRNDFESKFSRDIDENSRDSLHFRKRDQLYKTVIVIDEAHLMFDYNRRSTEHYEFPDTSVIEKALHKSYKVSGGDSARVMLLTATPIESDPNVFLQLLNLITETPLQETFPELRANLKHLPRTMAGQAEKDYTKVKPLTPAVWKTLESEKFANAIRGLISWNASEDDITRFAVKKEIKMPVVASDMIIDAFSHCISTNANDKKKLAICLKRRSNLAVGLPHLSKMYVDKDAYGKVTREMIEQESPKLLSMMDTIRMLDEKDKQKHGCTFKHMIFSSADRGFGAKIIAGALKNYLGMKLRVPKLGNSGTRIGRKVIYNAKFIPEHIEKKDIGNCFSVLTQTKLRKQDAPLTGEQITAAKEFMKAAFNCRGGGIDVAYGKLGDNAFGQEARILVLGEKFREGVDVFDVKYVHMLEEQTTQALKTQAEGRAFRNCGQCCLPFKAYKGWVVQVRTYENTIPHDILTKNKKLIEEYNKPIPRAPRRKKGDPPAPKRPRRVKPKDISNVSTIPNGQVAKYIRELLGSGGETYKDTQKMYALMKQLRADFFIPDAKSLVEAAMKDKHRRNGSPNKSPSPRSHRISPSVPQSAKIRQIVAQKNPRSPPRTSPVKSPRSTRTSPAKSIGYVRNAAGGSIRIRVSPSNSNTTIARVTENNSKKKKEIKEFLKELHKMRTIM